MHPTAVHLRAANPTPWRRTLVTAEGGTDVERHPRRTRLGRVALAGSDGRRVGAPAPPRDRRDDGDRLPHLRSAGRADDRGAARHGRAVLALRALLRHPVDAPGDRAPLGDRRSAVRSVPCRLRGAPATAAGDRRRRRRDGRARDARPRGRGRLRPAGSDGEPREGAPRGAQRRTAPSARTRRPCRTVHRLRRRRRPRPEGRRHRRHRRLQLVAWRRTRRRGARRPPAPPPDRARVVARRRRAAARGTLPRLDARAGRTRTPRLSAAPSRDARTRRRRRLAPRRERPACRPSGRAGARRHP